MARKPKTEADIQKLCYEIGEIICPPCGQPIWMHSRTGKCPTTKRKSITKERDL